MVEPKGLIELKLALALMLVVEGLIYAIFPQSMQAMMARLTKISPAILRYSGLGAAVLGVGLIWLLRR